MIDRHFETKSVRMEPMVLLTFQAPAADVDRIMEAAVAIVPLAMGKYDSNAYQTAEGIERYRPWKGPRRERKLNSANGQAPSK